LLLHLLAIEAAGRLLLFLGILPLEGTGDFLADARFVGPQLGELALDAVADVGVERGLPAARGGGRVGGVGELVDERGCELYEGLSELNGDCPGQYTR
jgi:hypothetical protein